MTKYEEYQLKWMIEHGHSLNDLFNRIEDYNDLKNKQIQDLFEMWEIDYGFEGSEIWASEDEFYQNNCTFNYCVMSKDKECIDAFACEEDAINFCKNYEDAEKVLEVQYENGEEISIACVYIK